MEGLEYHPLTTIYNMTYPEERRKKRERIKSESTGSYAECTKCDREYRRRSHNPRGLCPACFLASAPLLRTPVYCRKFARRVKRENK